MPGRYSLTRTPIREARNRILHECYSAAFQDRALPCNESLNRMIGDDPKDGRAAHILWQLKRDGLCQVKTFGGHRIAFLPWSNLSSRDPREDLGDICLKASSIWMLAEEDVLSHRQFGPLMDCRRGIALVASEAGFSNNQIAEHFGRDHTCIIFWKRRGFWQEEHDRTFRERVAALQLAYNGKERWHEQTPGLRHTKADEAAKADGARSACDAC